MPTLTERRLAELQAKPDPTPWEQRYMKYLANEARKWARQKERLRDPVFRGEYKLRSYLRAEAKEGARA